MSRITISHDANDLIVSTSTDIEAWLRYNDKEQVDRKHVERWHTDLKKALECKQNTPRGGRIKANTKI